MPSISRVLTRLGVKSWVHVAETVQIWTVLLGGAWSRFRSLAGDQSLAALDTLPDALDHADPLAGLPDLHLAATVGASDTLMVHGDGLLCD